MYIQTEGTLFFDPQGARPGGFCGFCGGECYAPGLHCLYCERRGAYDTGRTEHLL